ncbi:heme-binding protein [Streptomyces sp. NPDC050418]|uniref:heme-binding protein n=1 Tax=Streptomyces sp. NPDC050418 TaxID=3365612 RepID=UPI0037A209C4
MSTRTTVCALLLAAAATVSSVLPAAASDTPPAAGASATSPSWMYRDSHVSAPAALKIAQRTLAAAKAAGQRVSVAIVDRNGTVIAQVRGDGAGPLTMESAVRKAATAAHFCTPTSVLAERLATNPGLRDLPGSLFLGGGVPVPGEPTCLAGIGVGGAPSGDQDEAFARAGLSALGK